GKITNSSGVPVRLMVITADRTAYPVTSMICMIPGRDRFVIAEQGGWALHFKVLAIFMSLLARKCCKATRSRPTARCHECRAAMT
ncbi:hypothetical protein, partial [Streptomyces sp. NPDC005131]